MAELGSNGFENYSKRVLKIFSNPRGSVTKFSNDIAFFPRTLGIYVRKLMIEGMTKGLFLEGLLNNINGGRDDY